MEAALRIWSKIVASSSLLVKFIGGGFYGLFHALGWFMLLIVLVWGYGIPGQEVFVDFPTETIITRSTPLLPPGVKQQQIGFGEITAIRGEFERPDESDYKYYVLTATTRGGVGFKLAQDYSDSYEPPSKLLALAQTIADESGARLDLR